MAWFAGQLGTGAGTGINEDLLRNSSSESSYKDLRCCCDQFWSRSSGPVGPISQSISKPFPIPGRYRRHTPVVCVQHQRHRYEAAPCPPCCLAQCQLSREIKNIAGMEETARRGCDTGDHEPKIRIKQFAYSFWFFHGQRGIRLHSWIDPSYIFTLYPSERPVR